MTDQFKLRDEFIRLGQVMKAVGLCESGSEAKEVITGGEVTVNGETELRRGRKLYPGDSFTYQGKTVSIQSRDED